MPRLVVAPEDLDLVPFDTLLMALARRFDAMVKHLGDGRSTYAVRHAGDRFAAMGLAFHAGSDLSDLTVATALPPQDS